MTGPNDADVIRLTREELYQKVWSVPMRTLAQRFGLSDVGLAKTCKREVMPFRAWLLGEEEDSRQGG